MTQRTCVVDACGKTASAPRGWCWAHYNKWRRYGDESKGFVQADCSVPECANKSRVRGMCDKHYRRVRTHGDPSIGRPVHGDVCEDDACESPAANAGLCNSHYYIKWTTAGRGREVMAAASAARRARVADSEEVEPGLSWRLLWQQGERDCYICGSPCDPDDYRTITNRAGRRQKIVGATHPSLDHVHPLSRGGTHVRGNVRLACSRCNRVKHARVLAA